MKKLLLFIFSFVLLFSLSTYSLAGKTDFAYYSYANVCAYFDAEAISSYYLGFLNKDCDLVGRTSSINLMKRIQPYLIKRDRNTILKLKSVISENYKLICEIGEQDRKNKTDTFLDLISRVHRNVDLRIRKSFLGY